MIVEPGRSAVLVAAVGLALFTVPSTSWAGTSSAPGQVLDGSDLNAGYECDTNQGVGPGNPAHTGCIGGGPGAS